MFYGVIVYGETVRSKVVAAWYYVPNIAATLGTRIRKLRLEGGLTLAVLATAAGVSTSYLNDIEHNRNLPSLERLSWIADALGTDVRSLLIGIPPFDKGKPAR